MDNSVNNSRSNIIDKNNLFEFHTIITYVIKTIAKLSDNLNTQCNKNNSLYESSTEIFCDSISEQARDSLNEIVKNNMISISEINNKLDTLKEERNGLLKRIDELERQIKDFNESKKTYSEVVRCESETVNFLTKNVTVNEQKERKNDLFIIGIPKLKDKENLHKFIRAYASFCNMDDFAFNELTLIRQVEIKSKRTDKKRFPIIVKSKTNALKQALFTQRKIVLEQIINYSKNKNIEIEFTEEHNGEAIVLPFNLLTKSNADLYFQIKSHKSNVSLITALDTEKGALYVREKNSKKKHFIYSLSQYLNILNSIGVEVNRTAVST